MNKVELKLENRSYEIIIKSDIAFEISKELKKIKDIRHSTYFNDRYFRWTFL